LTDQDSRDVRGRADKKWARPLAGVAGVVVVVLLLRGLRRGPLWSQDVIFVLLVLSPLILNGFGWLRFRKAVCEQRLGLKRKTVVGLGLLANSIAIAIPWVVFLVAVYNFRRQAVVHDLDWNTSLICISILSMFSLIAGAIAPGWIRVTLVLNSLIVAGLALSIPMGVL